MRAHGPPEPLVRPRFPVMLVTTESVHHESDGERRAADEIFAVVRGIKTPTAPTSKPAWPEVWAAGSPQAMAARSAGGFAADAQRREAENILDRAGPAGSVMNQDQSKACAHEQ